MENRWIKRFADIGFSLAFLVLVFPFVYVIIGGLIKLDSKGPVFFRQYRTGKDDKQFLCYKFRTMRTNNDDESRQATKGDTRITPIGAFLRKTSLDELPQFINVLLGEMSVVGPRPMMVKHTEDFKKIVHRFEDRQVVTPGITGHAQVNGYRGEISSGNSIQDRVEYDLWYIRHWNPWLDIKIVYQTVMNMLKGEDNAY
ncbi:MAG: exopolysaccharide biosynthesis polyprenyl glycosylphosphotransferase [Bacteroidota bacterium]